VQWKKTVSSALDIEAKSGPISAPGTRFPVIKPDLPTRGPTVALRKGSSSQNRRHAPGAGSDGGAGRELTTDTRTDAPTRRDRLWVYGGVAAVALTAIGGSWVLSKPRAPLAPVPAIGGKFSRWQGTPPPPLIEPTQVPPASSQSTGASFETNAPEGDVTFGPPAPMGPPAPPALPLAPKTETPASTPPSSRAHADKSRSRVHTPKRVTAPQTSQPQAPPVPSDHRPNPFD
jgi:hypothetical protein